MVLKGIMMQQPLKQNYLFASALSITLFIPSLVSCMNYDQSSMTPEPTEKSFAQQLEGAVKEYYTTFRLRRRNSSTLFTITDEGHELLYLFTDEDNDAENVDRIHCEAAHKVWQQFNKEHPAIVHEALAEHVDQLIIEFCINQHPEDHLTAIEVYNHSRFTCESKHEGIVTGDNLKKIIDEHVEKVKYLRN